MKKNDISTQSVQDFANILQANFPGGIKLSDISVISADEVNKANMDFKPQQPQPQPNNHIANSYSSKIQR